MKVLKTTGILLLVLLTVAMIFMLVVPDKQHIERTITINAPASAVYQYLARPGAFHNWMVWYSKDSMLKTTGGNANDTAGRILAWIGNPASSGKGVVIFTTMAINRQIGHDIHFLEPQKADASSKFKLEEVNGQTKLTWEFDLATPRPRNILNLFSNPDKKWGNDFEESLRNLKTIIEKDQLPAEAKSYDVVPLNFPPTTFAAYRQERVFRDAIPAFYADHLPPIYEEVMTVNAIPGSPSGLFYSWDADKQHADLAAALEIPPGTQLNGKDIQLVDIPASKAVYVDYYGDHTKSADAYKSIDQYLLSNNLKSKAPVIEQYITDPAVEKDTSKWLTRIIFLVE